MLCTFTTMAIVREVRKFGHLEELFGLLHPVHGCIQWGLLYAWKPEPEGGGRQSISSALFCRRCPYRVHAAFWSTTRYPSRSSNVCPWASQYGLYEGDTLKPRCEHTSTTGFPFR